MRPAAAGAGQPPRRAAFTGTKLQPAPSTSATPAIELRDVWYAVDGMTALEAIDLVVARGDFVGVIGPNGAGKTMLLKLVLGLIRPERGTVRVLGRAPGEVRGQVGYVPQHFEFDRRFPVRVLDVVRMGRLGRDEPAAASLERAREALGRVGLGDLGRRQIGALSGGQLQRVLIARALAMDAELLLLDEPTANLDARIAREIYELLARLSARRTIVLVDHDIGVLSRHVRSVACLNRRLHYHGPGEITHRLLEETYGHPVERVLHDSSSHPHGGHRHGPAD